jgi:hypothetical protein
MIPVVAILGLMLVWRVWHQSQTRALPLNWALIVAYSLPLAATGIALALYNIARFGSPFEFGQRYQLTIYVNVHEIGSQLITTANILPNIYNYLLRPPIVTGSFPFVFATWDPTSFPSFVPVPATYLAIEPIFGVIPSTPFVLFVLPALTVLRRTPMITPGQRFERIWLVGGLTAMVVCAFGILQIFVGITLRYLIDFLPLALILASVGLWVSIERTRDHPLAYRALLVTAGILVASSLYVGLLFETVDSIS